MVEVLAFALVLLLAVLLSELADRSILSVAVLFLGQGWFSVRQGSAYWPSPPILQL